MIANMKQLAFFYALLLVCVSFSLVLNSGQCWADTAAWGLTELMSSLAQIKSNHATFTEKKYLAILDAPMSSSGELIYNSPDYLEQITRIPKQQILKADKNDLLIKRGNKQYSVRLSDHPEAAVFVDGIRDTLSGNQVQLEKHFTLQFQGGIEQWELDLVPIDTRMAKWVSRIMIRGSNHVIQSIEYQQADGDRSVMLIQSIATDQ